MKIHEILESFYDMYKAPSYSLTIEQYTVYKDPSNKEMSEAIKESSFPALRFIADRESQEVYVFPSDIMHETVANKIYESKPKYLLFGMAEKDSGKFQANFGQAWGTQVKQEAYYEDVLKSDWGWLQKYFDMAPLFMTVMSRYKQS